MTPEQDEQARRNIGREIRLGLMAAGYDTARANTITDIAMLAVDEGSKRLQEVCSRLDLDDALTALQIALQLMSETSAALARHTTQTLSQIDGAVTSRVTITGGDPQ